MFEVDNSQHSQCIRNSFILASLVAVTFFVFYPIIFFDFINYDTAEYVYENIHVKSGLSWPNVRWALTTVHLGNWHPLTWISHMIDVELFGLRAGYHHAVNLTFHLVNTILLYGIFLKMTKDSLTSGFVAGLFALHPLHIESVAWVAERKDLLSTMFCFLTVNRYVEYVDRGRIGGDYYQMILLYIFGLMSKPMIVTLPFLLMLLDYWPLNRFQGLSGVDKLGSPLIGYRGKGKAGIIIEKIPLFMCSVLSCVVTYNAQKMTGAMLHLDHVPFASRLLNALVSYTEYIEKMTWPAELAILYPYDESLSIRRILVSIVVFFGMSLLSCFCMRRFKWLSVGWFWYLGTLVPVVGLIQVGSQSMADRYTYFPMIGLFIIVAWSCSELLFNRNVFLCWGLVIVILVVLGMVTRYQVQYWKSGVALFSRAIEVTENNFIAHNNLCLELYRAGRYLEAAEQCKIAVKIKPDYELSYNNLGMAYEKMERYAEAIDYYTDALKLNPQFSHAHHNLANVYYRLSMLDLAAAHYVQAIRNKFEQYESYYYLATILAGKGDMNRAISLLKTSLSLNPEYSEAMEALRQYDLQGHGVSR